MKVKRGYGFYLSFRRKTNLAYSFINDVSDDLGSCNKGGKMVK